jgi:hypothetical protein
MSLIRYGYLAVGLCVFASPWAQAKTVEVFLLGGQSNADGRAAVSGLPTNLQQPQFDVDFFFRVEGYHLYEDQLIALMPGCTESSLSDFGPEITFGRGMADSYADDPNTSVAIIKYANGGSSLYSDWIAPSGPDYLAFKDTITAGLDTLRAQYPGDTVRVGGMIWMQGENDSLSDVYAKAYESNLTSFIADVRSNYGADLPFVIGRLSANQIGLSYPAGVQTVRNAQTAVADADSRVGLVDTDSYSMKSDYIHFDTAGQQSLGYDFATVMRATMAEDPNPPGPVTLPPVRAHYNFDTDYSDSSGHGFHGTALDGNFDGDTAGVGITNAAGESKFGGGAVSFTAERDWVDIPNQTFYSGDDYSVTFWARDLSDLATGGMVIGEAGGTNPSWFFIWLWDVAGDDGDYVRWRGSGTIPARQADFFVPLDNDWHHWALVAGDYDEDGAVDDITLYRDGEFVGTAPDKLTGFIFEDIGSAYGSNLDFDFEGQLDEVWIFEGALDQAGARALYLANGVPASDILGDADRNGVVDDKDASILGAHWLQTGMGWGDGDFNSDTVVDDKDAAILAAHWGEGGEGRSPSVPEPDTLVLLATAFVALFVRRRCCGPRADGRLLLA